MWGKKLLINIMLKAELIEIGIPELGLIVTVNGFQAVAMIMVQPQGQALKIVTPTFYKNKVLCK
jgi:hypothetical protein